MDKSDLTWGLPPDLSAHGQHIDVLINFLHVFMALLFVGWGIFFVYCLVRFRARPGQSATYQLIKAKPTKYLEIVVVIVEAVLLVGFSIPTWADYKTGRPKPADNPLEVRVVAEQFAWNIHYPGPDGEFGRTKSKLMSATNPVGLDDSDPLGEDDVVEINNLYIPTGRPVVVRLTSKDVIHCFWIPVLCVKQDVIPGMEVPIWFTAKDKGPHETYDISCAQLCGLGHYRMRGQVHIQTPEEFAEWYASAGEDEFFEEGDFEDEDD